MLVQERRDLEAILQPLRAPRVPLPSQARLLQLQLTTGLTHKRLSPWSEINYIVFVCWIIPLLGSALIVFKFKKELLWGSSKFSFCVLAWIYMITAFIFQRLAKRYISVTRVPEGEVRRLRRLVKTQNLLNRVFPFFLIVSIILYWWAVIIIAVNDAWDSGDGDAVNDAQDSDDDVFRLIVSETRIESFFLIPYQIVVVYTIYRMVKEHIEARKRQKWLIEKMNEQKKRTGEGCDKYSKDLEGDDVCAICQNNYEEGEDILQLPCDKRHYFHQDCLGNWLEIKSQCPLCRAAVYQFVQKTVTV